MGLKKSNKFVEKNVQATKTLQDCLIGKCKQEVLNYLIYESYN